MPGPDARQLTLEHQLHLAAAAEELAKQVKRIATRADGSAIDAWWLKAFPKLIELVAAFFTAILGLTHQYLKDHARAEGRVVDPVHAQWSTERVATSLRVMGPVAFKRSISNGRTPEQAINAMAQSLSAAAVRQALAADRETLTATVEAGGDVIGWRRVPDADPCAFCAMLVSRGAVYHTGATAGDVRLGGEPYHDHDQCTAEPLYEHEDEPAEVQQLQDAWRRVTARHSGDDAIRVWREWWDRGGSDDLNTPAREGERPAVVVPAPPVQPTPQQNEEERRRLPVAVMVSAWGVPIDEHGQPIVGQFRDVPTAIRDIADELDEMRLTGAGNSTVRRAALAELDKIMPWLRGREDLLAREGEFRDFIDTSGSQAIVRVIRNLAEDFELPPDFSGGHDADGAPVDLSAITPEERLIDALIPRTDREASERERRAKAIIEARLNGTYAGLRVEVDRVEVDVGSLEFEARIFDENGAEVGTTTRIFHRDPDGTLWVYHAYLKLDKNVQGQGFAQAWNDSLMDWYSDSGLDRIEVTANIDVGGYTWARQGFDFKDKNNALVLGDLLEFEVVKHAGRWDQDQIDAVFAFVARLRGDFNDPNYPTAYEMSQVGRKPGQGKSDRWPGKQAMLGSTWSGVKPVRPKSATRV